MRVIVIGTRASLLAQAQTRFVLASLKENWPETEFKVRTVEAREGGDWAASAALQNALANRQVDIAVHSLKHLPIAETFGIKLAAVPKRLEPREAFVGRTAKRLEELLQGASVGVNNLTRRSQLLALRPDLKVEEVGGDLDERLARLGELDGLIIGAASLLRLDLRNRIDQLVSPEDLLPMPAQGALGLTTRLGDDWAEELAYSLNHRGSADRVKAERAFLRGLGAGDGCPAGALAAIESDNTLVLSGVVCSPDGKDLIRAEIEGDAEEAEELGSELAHDLLNEGGREILGAAAQP